MSSLLHSRHKYCGNRIGHFYALTSRMRSIRIWQDGQSPAIRLVCKLPPPQKTSDPSISCWARQMKEILSYQILQTQLSGIFSPLYSPWPSMMQMNIWRLQMLIAVCLYEVIWALQGSFLEVMAAQLFEVNIMTHIIGLFSVHTKNITTQRVPKVKTE